MTDRLTEEIIWDTRKSVPLKKFEGAHKTPCVVQLEGNNKDTKLSAEFTDGKALLLHSVVSHRRIICDCAGSTGSDPSDGHNKRFSMPIGYGGLVELLSESGEASRPLQSISEVASTSSERFLIRSRTVALAEVTDKTSIRTLDRGTVLTVKGTARITSRHVTETYLHCTDKEGYYLYLDFNTRGVFSPFAGPKNISGVHTIHSLLKRFRLPCVVRVVSGKIPRQACDDGRPGVFRLLELRKEKVAMLAPLSAKQMLIPLSLKADVSFYRPANMKELSQHYIFQQLLDSCTHKVEQYFKTIQVLINSKPRKLESPANHEEENSLFEDVDEIYPYIRKGGIPPRMMRAHSLDNETITATSPTDVYSRSSSQPIINCGRERSGSLVVSQVVKKHTVSSAKTETTFQFQSTSNSLTLGKTDVLRQFIEKYASKESLLSRSSQEQSASYSDDGIYFTLDNNDCGKLSSVKDILIPSEVTEPSSNRG